MKMRRPAQAGRRTSLLVSVMFFADWKANEMRVDSRYYPVLQ